MNKVHKAFVFKLRPNREQRVVMFQHAGAVRYVYNRMLAERIEYYETTQKSLSKNTQLKELPKWKNDAETSWLQAIHSQVLQQAGIDLDNAYQHFFRRVKQGGEKAGFPRFKRRKIVGNRFRYPQGVKIKGEEIYLPKIGWMKFRKSQEIPEEMKSVTVRQKASGWYVSILCEVEIEALPVNERTVGVDVGVGELAVTSDGKKYPNPKAYRRLERKLGREQRKLSRKQKGSANWYKQAMKVARIHERIHNIRKDHHHQTSWRIVSENQVIYAEDLYVKGMVKNRKLSKSISDASMAGLLEKIAYKSAWYGRDFHKIDRWFPSSKTCHCCGYKLAQLELNVRLWRCPQCHEIHDRDLNAAKNILAVGQTESAKRLWRARKTVPDGNA